MQSVNVSILPRDSGNYNLGSNDKRWKDVYGKYLDITRSFSSGIEIALRLKNTDTSWYASPAILFEQSYSGYENHKVRIYSILNALYIDATTDGSTWSTALRIYSNLLSTRDIRPMNDDYFDLGSSSFRWKSVYSLFVSVTRNFTSGVETGLILENKADDYFSPKIVFKNNESTTEGKYQVAIYGYMNALRVASTEDNWSSQKIVATFGYNEILFNNTVRPISDGNIDLGTSDYMWRNIYGSFLSITRSFTGDPETGIVLENKSTDANAIYSPSLIFKVNSTTPSYTQFRICYYNNQLLFQFYDDNTGYWYSLLSADASENSVKAVHIRSFSDGDYDLGTSDYRWNNIYSCKNIIIRSFDTNPQYAYAAEDGLVLKNKSTNTTLSPKILFENSDAPDEKVAIVAGRGEYGYVLSVCSTPDNWSTIYAPLEIGIDGIDIVTSTHLYPAGDGEYDLGSSNRRWRNLYVVNLYTGDINLNNGWKVTELPDGLVVKDPSGEEIFKITKDGIWFKGKKIGE